MRIFQQKVIFSVILLAYFGFAEAQNTEKQSFASEIITAPFVSDGQRYITTLNEDGFAEFTFVFLGGNTYRIGVKSLANFKIHFQLVDIPGNVIFDSQKYNYPVFWNFSFDYTQPCKIRVIGLNLDKKLTSKQVEVAIGYKKYIPTK